MGFQQNILNLMPKQKLVQEKDVLIQRLHKITLEKIGYAYSLTEARIRQIEKIAIKKVKSKLYQQILFKLPKQLEK